MCDNTAGYHNGLLRAHWVSIVLSGWFRKYVKPINERTPFSVLYPMYPYTPCRLKQLCFQYCWKCDTHFAKHSVCVCGREKHSLWKRKKCNDGGKWQTCSFSFSLCVSSLIAQTVSWWQVESFRASKQIYIYIFAVSPLHTPKRSTNNSNSYLYTNLIYI